MFAEARGSREIEPILREELERFPNLAAELVSGDVRLDRWPLRERIAPAGNLEGT
jgi:hypothetical protein